MARRKALKQQARGTQLRLGSPPAVQGRRHERVQTDNYLEAIYNDPPCEDTCTQTDLFLDRPVSPLFVPATTGADAETQIYPGDVRLIINFYASCKLSTFVGTTQFHHKCIKLFNISYIHDYQRFALLKLKSENKNRLFTWILSKIIHTWKSFLK